MISADNGLNHVNNPYTGKCLHCGEYSDLCGGFYTPHCYFAEEVARKLIEKVSK